MVLGKMELVVIENNVKTRHTRSDKKVSVIRLIDCWPLSLSKYSSPPHILFPKVFQFHGASPENLLLNCPATSLTNLFFYHQWCQHAMLSALISISDVRKNRT